jgi:hypothetical protein
VLTLARAVLQALASDLVTDLDSLSDTLAARPLDAQASLDALRASLASTGTTVTELTRIRDALTQVQVSV